MTKHHWEIIDMGNVQVSSTPEGLWKQACSYFRWCDENPIKRPVKIKSGRGAGAEVVDTLPRAYHLKALCLHCGIEEEWLRDIRQQKDTNSLYYHVVSKILYVIYSQQYELASVGELNPIFTAKALNMDKEDSAPTGGVKVTIVGDLPALSNTENEVLEKLELEQQLNGNTNFGNMGEQFS